MKITWNILFLISFNHWWTIWIVIVSEKFFPKFVQHHCWFPRFFIFYLTEVDSWSYADIIKWWSVFCNFLIFTDKVDGVGNLKQTKVYWLNTWTTPYNIYMRTKMNILNNNNLLKFSKFEFLGIIEYIIYKVDSNVKRVF